MFRKLAKVALPLVVLGVIAAVTIGSTCCSPSITLPALTFGGIPIPSMTIPTICF